MLTSSTISLLEKTERPTTCLSATSHSASASPTCRCSAASAPPSRLLSTSPYSFCARRKLRESGAAAPASAIASAAADDDSGAGAASSSVRVDSDIVATRAWCLRRALGSLSP